MPKTKPSSKPTKRQTLAALRASIRKWDKLSKIDHLPSRMPNAEDCPLCDLFLAGREVGQECCDGCPVMTRTRARYCYSTPYYEVKKAFWRSDLSAFVTHSASMRDFLTRLLPKKTKNHLTKPFTTQ